MFSSITILVTYVVLALPAAAIGIPWAMLSGNISLLYRWSMWILRTGVKLARIRVQVAGREHIPARTCIFMSNHVSNLDPPILYPELPFRTAFFLKRSLIKIPILGLGMRLANLFRWTAMAVWSPRVRAFRREAKSWLRWQVAALQEGAVYLAMESAAVRASITSALPRWMWTDEAAL